MFNLRIPNKKNRQLPSGNVSPINLIMVRCKGTCKSGLRCKKKTESMYCGIHDTSIRCGTCNKYVILNERISLTKCSHVFCKDCISDSVMRKYPNGFNTEDSMNCPCCNIELSDESWKRVSTYIVDSGILFRRIMYYTYLCREEYVSQKNITLNKSYSFKDLYTLNLPFNSSHADRVYFEWRPKYLYVDIKMYVFLIGEKSNTFCFEDLKKELIEYVFHPKRIERFGGMEYVDII